MSRGDERSRAGRSSAMPISASLRASVTGPPSSPVCSMCFLLPERPGDDRSRNQARARHFVGVRQALHGLIVESRGTGELERGKGERRRR